MALEIFKLVGSIFIDNEKANDSLQKTDKKATSVAEGLGKAGKVAAGAAAAIGTAIIGTGTALVGMANDASKTADDIDKMSQKIGMSAEGYQEWSYIMEQNGMDVDKLQTGMKTLVNQMDKVKSGNEDAIATFQQLGVEVLNADGSMRSQEEVMNDTIRALAGMKNSAERAKLATELFGKAGTEMAPMLNQGAGAIDDLKQRAHDLGLVMSDEAIKAGVEYGDLSNDLQKSFSMLKTNLGAALFPVLNSLIKKLIEFMPILQKLGEKLGPVASNFIEKLLPPLADMAGEILPVLMDAVGEIIPLLAEITDEIVPVLVDVIKTLLPVAVEIITTVLPVLLDLVKLITPILVLLLNAISPILEVVMKLLTPLLQLVSAILTPILQLITAVLEPLLELVVNILTPIIEIVSIILEPLTALLSAILEPLCDVLGIIIPMLVEIFNDILTPLFELLKKAFEWAAPVATKVFNWLQGFFEFVIENVSSEMVPMLQGAWDFLKGFAKFFGENFVNTFKTAIEKIGNFFSNVWEGMKTTFKNGINFWIDGINKLITGINSLSVPDWVTKATGISGINLPTIPALAEGGNIQKAGTVLVGERGPELLNLPEGAKVSPLNRGTDIDYGKLASAMVQAMKEAGFGTFVNHIYMDGNLSETQVVNALALANYRSGGR